MPEFKNLKDCKVIVRDSGSGTVIAETEILDYDEELLIISVDCKFFDPYHYEKVTLLILNKSSIFEFKGTIRKKSAPGVREIALYKGQSKEDRAAERYDVNIPAKVQHLLIANKPVLLRKSLDVIVLNMSREGTLLKTHLNAFNIGTSFPLIINTGGSETSIHTTVVRIHVIDDAFAEYGCKFNF